MINTDGVVVTDAALENKDIAKDLYTSARGDFLSSNFGMEALLSVSTVNIFFSIMRLFLHFTFR